MHKNRHFILIAAGVVATVLSVGSKADEFYRQYAPRTAIDPAKGVAGDFSGTYQYWKDAAALEKHSDWISDQDNRWKLNYKYMDLDRIDPHEGHLALDQGEKLLKSWVARESGFLTCLGEGQKELKGLAARYPKYDPVLKRVMTVESRVEYCAETELWETVKQGSPPNTKVSLYIKSLSAGQPINVDLGSKPIFDAYKRGEDLFYTRVGQLNFACATCHTPQGVMGHKLRGELPNTPFGDAAHFPTYRTPVGEIESIHQRFNRCLNQMRVALLKPGDPVFTDLEVFYTVLSNGYPVSVPSAR